RAIAGLAALFLVLHDAEEAVAFHRYLPQVAEKLPSLMRPVAERITYPALLWALAVVTIIGVSIALWVVMRSESRAALWSLLVLEVTLAVNVLSHLVGAVVVFRGYSPGLATAALVNAPFAAYVIRRAVRERWVSGTALATSVPAALIIHGPVLLGSLWLIGHLAR
ncbi:MAG TPA: HXXEE domain-containing protein, partial [Gemmatimonadaceae bacterium]|nr:HXXEE domain-containing protein [Gemmatimonadaceae bacterium]